MIGPANWWMWCVLAGHNLRDGKCLRCGETHIEPVEDTATIPKRKD